MAPNNTIIKDERLFCNRREFQFFLVAAVRPRYDVLNSKGNFSHTPYAFAKLAEVCEMLARKIVVAQSGTIEKQEGEEVFVIPVVAPKPSKLERSWEPGPIAKSMFADAEKAEITAP